MSVDYTTNTWAPYAVPESKWASYEHTALWTPCDRRTDWHIWVLTGRFVQCGIAPTLAVDWAFGQIGPMHNSFDELVKRGKRYWMWQAFMDEKDGYGDVLGPMCRWQQGETWLTRYPEKWNQSLCAAILKEHKSFDERTRLMKFFYHNGVSFVMAKEMLMLKSFYHGSKVWEVYDNSALGDLKGMGNHEGNGWRDRALFTQGKVWSVTWRQSVDVPPPGPPSQGY